MYDDEGKAKRNQFLRKKNNPSKTKRILKCRRAVQTGGFTKRSEGIGNIKHVKASFTFFNNAL